MKQWITRHLGTLVCAAAAALVVVGVYVYEAQTRTGSTVNLLLSDGFFVAGVLFTGMGLLTVIAKAGGFDGLGYIFYGLKARFNHSATNWKSDKSFAQYREERRESKRGFRGSLTVGLICLALAVLFDVLFTVA